MNNIEKKKKGEGDYFHGGSKSTNQLTNEFHFSNYEKPIDCCVHSRKPLIVANMFCINSQGFYFNDLDNRYFSQYKKWSLILIRSVSIYMRKVESTSSVIVEESSSDPNSNNVVDKNVIVDPTINNSTSNNENSESGSEEEKTNSTKISDSNNNNVKNNVQEEFQYIAKPVKEYLADTLTEIGKQYNMLPFDTNPELPLYWYPIIKFLSKDQFCKHKGDPKDGNDEKIDTDSSVTDSSITGIFFFFF